MRTPRFLFPLSALLLLPMASPGHAAVVNRLGLFGPGYMDSEGAEESYFDEVAGKYAIGDSERYDGDNFNGAAAWLTDGITGATTRLGFTGPAFTATSGFQESYPDFLEGNHVAGYSFFYSGTNYLGMAVWTANATTGSSTRIGLFDAEHTQSTGAQESEIIYLKGGRIAGTSRKYAGLATLGQDAWVASADTGVTTRIGLFTPEFTQTSGFQQSSIFRMDAGKVLGISLRYSGSAARGQAAWVADATTGATTRLGFFDAGYTGADGLQNSGVVSLQGNYASGYSTIYQGSDNLGAAAWVANVTTGVATRIGLYQGAEYVSTANIQSSSPRLLQNGKVAGTSARFVGATPAGQSAWVADAVTGVTTRVGLFGAGFTSASGAQDSGPLLMDGAYVGGYSTPYLGAAPNVGRAIWVAGANTGATKRVGLISGEFTHPTTGEQSSELEFLGAGNAVGTSARYSATGAQHGQAVWVAASLTGVTTRAGLSGAAQTRSDGYQFSQVDFLEGDFAGGYSFSFSGLNYHGQTAWILDCEDEVLSPIILSQRPDGFSYSQILNLYDTGLAVGRYTLFDNAGIDLGYRAFFWTPEWGARDLGSVVPGGLAAAGWEQLNFASYADPATMTIFGYGTVIGQNEDSEVLYAATIPEPGSVALLGLGAMLFGMRRRKGA